MPMDVAIVTPEREMWSGEADFVRARSADGDLGILPSHAPFLGSLGNATLVIQTASEQKFIAVHGGFIQVFDNKVSVLTGTAELAAEIDIERAKRARERAESELRGDAENPELQAALVRATTRMNTAAEAGLLNIG